jgi:hypothetical protein
VRKSVTILVLTLMASMWLSISMRLAAQTTQVLVVPSPVEVSPGGEFDVDVQVHDVEDLYGLDVRLTFDPTLLEAVELVAGDVFPPAVFEAEKTLDNDAGQVKYVVTFMPPSTPFTGSGALAQITFRALSPGSSELGINAVLANTSAESIPLTVSAGSVVIGGQTATPSPTLQPGAHRAYLPVILRQPFIPGPTPAGSETPSATPVPTTTGTVTPSLTPSATPSETPSPGPYYQQLVVNPSFETDEAWEILRTVYPAGYSVSRARKGLRSMRLGIIGPYPQPVYSSVQQTVEIPAAAEEALLSFYYFPVSSSVDADYLYLVLYRASDNVRLRTVRWMDRYQSWNLQSLDLLQYAGERIRLQIGLYNDGQGVTTVYLDDVELWIRAEEG